MKTQFIITINALLLAVIGLSLLFTPQEVLTLLTGNPATLELLPFVQSAGLLYFAFAIINWYARHSIVGGIYNRPLVLGNVTHYVAGGIAFAKSLPQSHLAMHWYFTLLFLTAGCVFVVILFSDPHS
ncbi:MAG: hypothetical protein AB7K37_05595 [Cyclobacteriaceae bacterium]